MRIAVFALALAVAAPAFAADSPTAAVAHAGDMLRDAHNFRLASVDSVSKDGSVAIIYEGRVVTVPAASLSVVNGKLTTSLTKDQLNAM